MTKRNYEDMNYWQRQEAEKTEQEKTDKRMNLFLIAGYLGMLVVALFQML